MTARIRRRPHVIRRRNVATLEIQHAHHRRPHVIQRRNVATMTANVIRRAARMQTTMIARPHAIQIHNVVTMMGFAQCSVHPLMTQIAWAVHHVQEELLTLVEIGCARR